jgi:hypothetical protein
MFFKSRIVSLAGWRLFLKQRCPSWRPNKKIECTNNFKKFYQEIFVHQRAGTGDA